VDLAVPGLSAALTRAGSLAGAVGQLLPDDAATRGPRRARLRGGLTQLVTALTERLLLLDADLRVNHRARGLTRTPDGWLVHLDPADPRDEAELSAQESAEPLPADIVVLAAGAATSAALVRDHGIVLEAAPLPVRDVVTLVMDAGTAASDGPATIYPVPGAMAAASVIDVGSAWAGVRAHAGPGRRVLRLTFDAAPADDATDLIARAAADAAQLWPGIGGVRAAAQRRATLAPPASVLGHAQRTAATRAAIGRRHGLIAVGEDLAGGGVSAIVADTLAEVERVRHEVLWTPPSTRPSSGTAP
jgi:oxygen-dependent protoporphyrinogen oxidase